MSSSGDSEMNHRILAKLGKVPLRKDTAAQKVFRYHGLEKVTDISAVDKGELSRKMLINWDSKEKFVEAVAGKVPGVDAARAELIFDQEKRLAVGRGSQEIARKKGATKKTWVLGTSESGPCPLCKSMAGETVEISEAYSTGDMSPCETHVNCCCSEEYSSDSEE